ncbi:hypothetical protein Cus16_2296 [Curtobacterium sp. ER1/6]|nr:hypothetical protein Cus16_2296 [Curtobacterium sp. ER1/6]
MLVVVVLVAGVAVPVVHEVDVVAVLDGLVLAAVLLVVVSRDVVLGDAVRLGLGLDGGGGVRVRHGSS